MPAPDENGLVCGIVPAALSAVLQSAAHSKAGSILEVRMCSRCWQPHGSRSSGSLPGYVSAPEPVPIGKIGDFFDALWLQQ